MAQHHQNTHERTTITLYWRANPLRFLGATAPIDYVALAQQGAMHPPTRKTFLESAALDVGVYADKMPAGCPTCGCEMLLRSYLFAERGGRMHHQVQTKNWTVGFWCPHCNTTTTAPHLLTSAHAVLAAQTVFAKTIGHHSLYP